MLYLRLQADIQIMMRINNKGSKKVSLNLQQHHHIIESTKALISKVKVMSMELKLLLKMNLAFQSMKNNRLRKRNNRNQIVKWVNYYKKN